MILQTGILLYQICGFRFGAGKGNVYFNLPRSCFGAGSIPTQPNEGGQKQPNYNTNIAPSATRHRRRWTIFLYNVSTRARPRLGFVPPLAITQPAQDQQMTMDQWLSERKMLPRVLRRGFDVLFLLVSWLIWKERNSRMFERFSSGV